MFISRLSLAGPQRGLNKCNLALAAKLMPLGMTALLIVACGSGCRTPWRSNSAEPNFDRLIEIEQQSGQRGVQREPLASRTRPGPAKYPTAGLVPPAATASASLSISDRAAPDNADEMEEMLVDVPAAQRELLRREINTLHARNQSATELNQDDEAQIPPSQTSKKAPLKSFAAEESGKASPDRSPASERSRKAAYAADLANVDSEEESQQDFEQADYSGSSKYQLLAEGSNRQPRAAPIKPRAVDAPYSRKLTDQAPASSARTETPQALAQRSQLSANGVVAASHVEAAQPADSQPTAAEQPAESFPDELDWRQHIAAAIAQLEQQPTTSTPEEKIHMQMVDRLLHMSLGDIEAASEPIDGLQTNGQDFIRHSLKSLYEVTNPTGNPVEIKRYTLAMLSQRQALSHLAAVSNLDVRNATFCTEVDGFGVVTKFPQYTFKPDQELLLYCELDNFVSTHTEGKGYETQLQGSYEIVDANGRRVADQLLPMDSHLCRNQRRDYFIAYRMYMPQKIDPGKYQLKLTVEDMKGRKFGQAALDFQIQ